MKRYQVYLNPHSVSVIDEFQNLSDISRSRVIRYLVDAISQQLIAVIKRKEPEGKYFMDTLAGFIDLKTNKKLDLVSTIDNTLIQNI